MSLGTCPCVSIMIKIEGSNGLVTYDKAIVDSGNTTTSGSVVSTSFLERHKIQWKRYPVGRPVGTAKRGSTLQIIGQVKELNIMIKGFPNSFIINPMVIDGLSHPINLGAQFMKKYKMSLSFNNVQGELRQEQSGGSTQLVATLGETTPLGEEDEVARVLEALRLEDSQVLAQDPELMEGTKQLIARYWKVFARPGEQYGATTAAEFTVELKEGSQPVKQPLRMMNPSDTASLKEQLKKWEEGGIIEKTKSPWSSCLVPVKRKDGHTRWAVDLRIVNGMTVGEAYPVPSIEGALERLSGSRIFSSLDAAAAYHAIPVAESSKVYLAFSTPFGTYTFCRMPFGAKNAGATFCRMVQEMIEELGSTKVLAYLDDLLLHTKDCEEHISELEGIFKIHLEYGILLKPEKTFLF